MPNKQGEGVEQSHWVQSSRLAVRALSQRSFGALVGVLSANLPGLGIDLCPFFMEEWMEVPVRSRILFLVISVSTASSSAEKRQFKEKMVRSILNLLSHGAVPGEMSLHIDSELHPGNLKFGTRPVALGITTL